MAVWLPLRSRLCVVVRVACGQTASGSFYLAGSQLTLTLSLFSCTETCKTRYRASMERRVQFRVTFVNTATSNMITWGREAL
jgi:hypothetical protein